MQDHLQFDYSYRLSALDINMHGHLRSSRLLELVQLVSGTHAEQLGLGESMLTPQGLAWVLVHQQIQMERMPRGGEAIHFTTWPGRGLHGLFPRYIQMDDEAGQPLGKACFLWVIMDLKERQMIQPASRSIHMPESSREALMPLPRLPKVLLPEVLQADFTVPFSDVDIVGHMNNARYLDLAENIIPVLKDGYVFKESLIEYSHELKLDETMQISLGQEESRFSLRGVKGEQTIITMFLEYDRE